MLHIAAAAIWVGGLYGVVTLVRKDRDLVWGVRRFSTVALCAYAAVGASGLINAWVRLGGLTTLFDSRYGLLVLAKVAALALLGWFGWRHRTVTIARLEAGAGRPKAGRPRVPTPGSEDARSKSRWTAMRCRWRPAPARAEGEPAADAFVREPVETGRPRRAARGGRSLGPGLRAG